MNSYYERAGRRPDFVVRYRFLTVDEGGRQGPFLQHTRWDFLFEADAASLDGLAMIWPEAIDRTGAALPEGEIASAGRAAMFIVNPERRKFHRARLAAGVRGFFMEGPKRVAECEVEEVLDQ